MENRWISYGYDGSNQPVSQSEKLAVSVSSCCLSQGLHGRGAANGSGRMARREIVGSARVPDSVWCAANHK